MDFLNTLPIWALGIGIFLCRIIDVPLGTFRTISVVQGQVQLAVALGFFEVFIWVMAISGVVARIGQSPLLALFYAAGFAAGNAVGINIERRFARGLFAIRIISTARAKEIADALHSPNRVLATLPGESPAGPINLVYVTTPLRKLSEVIETARKVDPGIFYLVERAQVWSDNLLPTHNPTGWRAILKKK